MNIYITTIRGICPKTGELKSYVGPNVRGITAQDAQRFCEENGLGYCKVVGLLVSEIPCKKGGEMINYDNLN
jgi:hypothetical protein